MKSKLKPLLTFLIGWPLSILALFFIVKTFLPRFTQIQQRIFDFNPWLLVIGIICFLSYYFLRSVVWQQLLAAIGYRFSLHETMYHWASSEFKRYIPGNIWSFVGRSVWLTNKGVSKKDVAKALIVEQELVLLGCMITALLSLAFLVRFLFPFLQQVPYLYQISIIFGILIILVYIFLSPILHRIPLTLPSPLGRGITVIKHVLPDFPAGETLRMLLLSSLSFLFFGLGYYFTITSFIFLHPQDIWSLSGFFVFSLLVGLFSFITPTGLGVREGMITFGLGKVIPLDIAGFVSILGRIILVLSEIVFLSLSYLYFRISSQYDWICLLGKKYLYEIILAVGIIVFCVYFTAISFLRYDNFYTGRFDLGNMDQTVWNTAHGRFFQITDPNGTETVSRLAFHADFILVLFAPLYWIWESPKMLLIVQVVVVGLGAVFVYLLTKEVLKKNSQFSILNSQLLPLALSISYLLNPSLQRSVMYDFHAVTLATTFLLGAFYFAYKQKYVWFLVFAILAGITKEQVWLITGLIGLYIVLQYTPHPTLLPKGEGINPQIKDSPSPSRERVGVRGMLFGFLVFLVSCSMFYVLIWHAIPNAAKSNGHFALNYFSDNSNSPSDLIKGIIFSPDKTWAKLTEKGRVEYMKKLLVPVGFLPLAAPYILIFPAADIILNFLGDKAALQQIYYQYTAAITPFLFVSTIFGIRSISKLILNSQFSILNFFTVYISVTALYGAYVYGPLPGSREPNVSMLATIPADKLYMNQVLQTIDPHYSVAASNSLGSHLSQREHIYVLPKGADVADIVIFLLNDNNNQPSHQWHQQKAEELRQNPEYEILFERRGFIVFKKGY